MTAPPEICFDLARDIDLHVKSILGRTNGRWEGSRRVSSDPTRKSSGGATHFGHSVAAHKPHNSVRQAKSFRDSLVPDAFSHFDHDHFFLAERGGAIMREVFD